MRADGAVEPTNWPGPCAGRWFVEIVASRAPSSRPFGHGDDKTEKPASLRFMSRTSWTHGDDKGLPVDPKIEKTGIDTFRVPVVKSPLGIVGLFRRSKQNYPKNKHSRDSSQMAEIGISESDSRTAPVLPRSRSWLSRWANG